MMRELKYYKVLMIALLCSQWLPAQQTSHEIAGVTDSTAPANSSFIVGEIIINGNKKTKAFIILREIPLQTGR